MALTGCEKDDDDNIVVVEPILLDCDYFTTDRVLEDNPDAPVDYIVPCVATVSADIVIQPGVVIEFKDDAGLKINSGYLKAEGTAANPIVFTGVNKVKGSWRGIIVFSESVNNIFDHVEISYGGGNSFNSNDDRGNLILYNGKIAVRNSTISNGAENGFDNIYSSGTVTDFSNNTITGNNKYPVNSLTIYGHMYDGSNDFTGNTDPYNYIFLVGNRNIGGNMVWEKTSVPYKVDKELWIGNDESLTIEAGAELRFDDDSGIKVKDGAYLDVNGTTTEPVLFSGVTEINDSWKGIFVDSDDVRNSIDYATIEYGGGGQFNSNGDLGLVIVYAGANLTISNSTLQHTTECAINATYNSETLVSTNNTFNDVGDEECQ